MTNRKSFPGLPGAMIACMAVSGGALAQGTCLAQPRSGMGLLKCPEELDAGAARRAGVQSTLQVETPVRAGWSALRVGMSELDVNMLLGTPDRVEGGGAEPSRWIWDRPGVKGGWVAFDPAARTVREWRTF